MISLSTTSQLKYLKWIHYIQPILFVMIFALGIARIVVKHGKITRQDTWIMAVTGKSLNVLAYEILSDRIPRLHRFASLKANMILNIIEVVFWMAAIVLSGKSVSSCSGPSCALSGVIMAVAIILLILSIPVAVISISFFRYKKKYGLHPDENHFSRTVNTYPITTSVMKV